MPESPLHIWILKWSIRTTCNNSSKWRRAERYWGRWCRFFILQLSGFVIHGGCGECHPSQGSFHAPVLHQSRLTFKVEFLCTDIKLTWWMIGQTKPELQSSIIRLQVMTQTVYTFTFNDTNLDVYHPATLILQTISFVSALYITERQEDLPRDPWLNISSVNCISWQLYHALNTPMMEDWKLVSICFSLRRGRDQTNQKELGVCRTFKQFKKI